MSADEPDNPFDLSAPGHPDDERGPFDADPDGDDPGGDMDVDEAVAADPSRFDATTLEELRTAGAEPREWRLSHDSSQRLDKYLQNRLKGISRNQVEKLIKIAAVTVNGKPAKKSAALREGDIVVVLVPPAPRSTSSAKTSRWTSSLKTSTCSSSTSGPASSCTPPASTARAPWSTRWSITSPKTAKTPPSRAPVPTTSAPASSTAWT